MAWIRWTDTATMHPIVLGVADHPDADDDTVDLVFGYVGRLIALVAQQGADYVIPFSSASQVAGSRSRAERLLGLAEYSGYGSLEVDDRTQRSFFRLVNDPELFHLKTGEELEWEKRRKADNANPGICAPVRCRDGDACRYCGNVVRFIGVRKGKLAGTYDHRPPGQPGSAETSVVACGECNSRRGNQPLEAADLLVPLMPPPREPYYHSSTREWLQGHRSILAQYGMTPPSLDPDQKNLLAGRPVPGADNAPAGVRPATGGTPGVAPSWQPKAPDEDTARSARPSASDPRKQSSRNPSPVDPSRSQQVGGVQDLDLPGRVGTGRDGPAQDGTQRKPSPGGAGRPKRRRGKRGGRRS